MSEVRPENWKSQLLMLFEKLFGAVEMDISGDAF